MRERLVDDMFVGGTSVVVWARACGDRACWRPSLWSTLVLCGSADAEFVLTARVILKHCCPPDDRH
jgi:hypothetical protein